MPEWGSTDVKEELVKKKEEQDNKTEEKKEDPEKNTEEIEQKTEAEKDQQTFPRAATPTPKSDVRTLDKPRDPEKTPRPPEKRHCRGWLIPITINQTSTLALLDTGATCTMIGRPLYETLHAVTPLKLKTDEDLRLEVIGGGAAPTLGTATVWIGIAGGTYEPEVIVSANRENPNCILGSDFFCQHDCELSMRKQQFHVGDRQVRCVPELERVVKTGLKIARRVELPARTEVIVPCKPTHASNWLQKTAAVAQPCSNQWRYAEDGIVIGSALKAPDQPETVIPVMNLTDEPRTLYRGTRIGEAHVVTGCGGVEGMLPGTVCDFEDGGGSGGGGWLRDGRIKYRPEAALRGRAAFGPTRVDPRMDPADLPECLRPLVEGGADDLALQRRGSWLLLSTSMETSSAVALLIWAERGWWGVHSTRGAGGRSGCRPAGCLLLGRRWRKKRCRRC